MDIKNIFYLKVKYQKNWLRLLNNWKYYRLVRIFLKFKKIKVKNNQFKDGLILQCLVLLKHL